MKLETISLRADEPDITLTAYVADDPGVRDAMLVIPGGGYSVVCSDREGEPIALAFMAQGYNCFVLHYSVGPRAKFPRPLVEASIAMKEIRARAKEWKIDPEHIHAVGFSAGGHLCAMLGNLWNLPEVERLAGIEHGENKPRGVALIYPVISAGKNAHRGSIVTLVGDPNAPQSAYEQVSIEKQIGPHSAPAFLMHTANDQVVPVLNSLLAAEAYAANHIHFELHVYPDAPHGIALANELTAGGYAPFINPRIARWVGDAADFFRGLDSYAEKY